MRTIVTGGAGFIGSALISGLNAAGITDITVVDNLGASEKWRNLIGKRFKRYLHKDAFLSAITSGDWKEKPDVIFHMGACSATTEMNADYLFSNNVHYSQTLCEYALKCNSRFIYASSAATYGLGENGYSDNMRGIDALRPINRYGFSKQVFDQWIVDQKLETKVAGLKFFNVFGPNEYHKGSMVSMAYRAYHQIKSTGSVKLFKSTTQRFADGEQRRDFIYVLDCVAALIALGQPSSRVNGIFNLGTGTSRSWNELAKAVFAAMKLPAQIEYVEMPPHLVSGYQNFTEAEMGKLKNALGTVQLTPLEAAVDDYVTRFLDANSATI